MERLPVIANIDLMDIGNKCNLQCRHCSYDVAGRKIKSSIYCSDNDCARTADAVFDQFTGSTFFIYPMEICTSLLLLPLMQRLGQKGVLSNGILLTEAIADKLIEHGIEEVKITLYANHKDHAYFYGVQSGGQFCGVSKEQYSRVIRNIEMCVKKGLRVVIETPLSTGTKKSVMSLTTLCNSIGVHRVELLRLLPVGKSKNLPKEEFLCEKDVLDIIVSAENFKALYETPRIRFHLMFGPDFFGKSEVEVKTKIAKHKNNFANTEYVCPAIGQGYLGVSLQTGRINGCLLGKNEKRFDAGSFDFATGRPTLIPNPVLDPALLSKKLRGICHRDNCQYHHLCLGGCRCATYSMARLNGIPNPFYAGMDVCITKCKEKLNL